MPSSALRVVIAPDSFKESLDAAGVAGAIAAGVRQAVPNAICDCIPMADGGEGSMDAILGATGGVRHQVIVRGPVGEPIKADWALLDSGDAVIEMAAAAGLEGLPPAKRNPLITSTYGVGQLMGAALDARARRIVLMLGGSATNDAGAGMLQAMGVRLLDEADQDVAPGGAALLRLRRIDSSGLDARLNDVEVVVASDVNNPLCGVNGASHVFGPQKGASVIDVNLLDSALENFANVSAQVLGRDLRNISGAGAAGGMGFAALSFLNARIQPGFDLIAELVHLFTHIRQADLVITGEGRLDGQTASGKTPAGVIRLARRAGVPVVALAGALQSGYESLYDEGLVAAFSIAPGPISLNEAYARATELLTSTARNVMRSIRLTTLVNR